MKHRTYSLLITGVVFFGVSLVLLAALTQRGAATSNQNRSSRVPAQSPSPSPSTTNEQFTKPEPSIDLIRQESTRGGIGPAGVSHLSKGADEYKAGRNAAAVPELREAIKENPKSDNPHYVLALALAADGKLKEAIEEYKQVIALATKDDPKILAYFNMGNTYADLRQYPEAIESYKAAIKIDPELSKPHNNLGLAYVALNQIENAAAEFGEAVRLKTSYAEARFNLGVAYIKLGKKQEAEAQHQALIELKSELAAKLESLIRN